MYFNAYTQKLIAWIQHVVPRHVIPLPSSGHKVKSECTKETEWSSLHRKPPKPTTQALLSVLTSLLSLPIDWRKLCLLFSEAFRNSLCLRKISVLLYFSTDQQKHWLHKFLSCAVFWTKYSLQILKSLFTISLEQHPE